MKFGSNPQTTYLLSYILVQKSVWRSPKSRIWTKLAFSNSLKVDHTCLLTYDHKFRIEITWTKLAFSMQVQHGILICFKHFSGPKYKTLGTYSEKAFRDALNAPRMPLSSMGWIIKIYLSEPTFNSKFKSDSIWSCLWHVDWNDFFMYAWWLIEGFNDWSRICCSIKLWLHFP